MHPSSGIPAMTGGALSIETVADRDDSTLPALSVAANSTVVEPSAVRVTVAGFSVAVTEAVCTPDSEYRME